MSVSDQFGEALKLAELVSEKTGLSMAAALEMLSDATREVAAVMQQNEASAEYMPAERRPFDVKRFRLFLDRSKPGVALTVAEVCEAAGMVFPPNAKAPAFIMKSAGWRDTGFRRGSCHVYQKPALEYRG